MGAKGSRENPLELTEEDRAALMEQSGYTESDVNEMFTEFLAQYPEGRMSREKFSELFIEMRPDEAHLAEEVCDNIFSCCDTDDDETLVFKEYMIAYLCLVVPEDQERLLAYASSLEEGDSEKSNKIRNAALVASGLLVGGAAIGGAAYAIHRRRKAKKAAVGTEEGEQVTEEI